jgi:hypothetical protein
MVGLLAVGLVQPVNLAWATESPVSPSGSELVSVVDTVADPANTPANCSTAPDRFNISFATGTETDPFTIASFEDLRCMQQLVNNGVTFSSSGESFAYRTGFHWQFSSFDAQSQTLFPMGSSESPFSGHIFVEPGLGESASAVISNLTIGAESPSNTTNIGMFAAVTNDFTLTGIHLQNVSVSGSNSVGSIIGAIQDAHVTIQNCSVTGTVNETLQSSWPAADTIGGLVGFVSVDSTLSLRQVSFSGDVVGEELVGGLVGVTKGVMDIRGATFDGKLRGPNYVSFAGGLLGYGFASLRISQAAVRLDVTNPYEYGGQLGGLVGGLVPLMPPEPVSLSIDNVVVVGSISGHVDVAGLVGQLANVASVSLTSVIQGIELSSNASSAGLIYSVHGTISLKVTLKSVINLARSTSVNPSYLGGAAGLMFRRNGAPFEFIVDQAFRWQGLSANRNTYRPFANGTVSSGSWAYNGEAVNCSNFSDLNFWTNSASMNLSTASGWDFSHISAGYLPSLNGQFPTQAFSCMNEITYPSSADTKVNVGFGSVSTLPVADTTNSVVHYFLPNSAMSQTTPPVAYRFSTLGQSTHDIFYNANLVNCSFSSAENWLLPTEGLLQDATISLRPGTSPCVVPNFQFTLAVEGTNLLLKWTAENTQSVAVSFPQLVNNAGGLPPVISAENLNYSGSATAFTHTLGEPMVGTYTIQVVGSILGQGETVYRPVAKTFTWTNYLLTKNQPASISYPDVFIGTSISKTIIYKNDDAWNAITVTGVNQSRYDAIRWLASVAVTEGSGTNSAGQTTYRAQDSVNRGAMAQFLQKLAGFTDQQILSAYGYKTTKFTDLGSLLSGANPNMARYYAILWLADTGITKGCNAAGTLFCPGNVVTRGQMAEFMRAFAGVDKTTATTSTFPDVNLTAKNVKYDKSGKTVWVPAVNNTARMGAINWLASTGITKGSDSSNGQTTFRPHDNVNRGAMAEFMRQLARLVGSTPS